ncbi:MAG: hypothetical protein PHG20_08050, partial [Geobacteraceae bacterium]|nr:hypothetical protein [Geobacteraceae bacterium]
TINTIFSLLFLCPEQCPSYTEKGISCQGCHFPPVAAGISRRPDAIPGGKKCALKEFRRDFLLYRR